jgi:hypothetical protein
VNHKSREIVELGPIDANRRYPLRVANALLSQSNSKTYEDIAAGRLIVIKDGKRTYIPGSEIIRRSGMAATQSGIKPSCVSQESKNERDALRDFLSTGNCAPWMQRRVGDYLVALVKGNPVIRDSVLFELTVAEHDIDPRRARKWLGERSA